MTDVFSTEGVEAFIIRELGGDYFEGKELHSFKPLTPTESNNRSAKLPIATTLNLGFNHCITLTFKL